MSRKARSERWTPFGLDREMTGAIEREILRHMQDHPVTIDEIEAHLRNFPVENLSEPTSGTFVEMGVSSTTDSTARSNRHTTTFTSGVMQNAVNERFVSPTHSTVPMDMTFRPNEFWRAFYNSAARWFTDIALIVGTMYVLARALS